MQCCCKKECFVKQHLYTFDNKKENAFFSLGWEKCVNSRKHTKDPYHTHAFEWNVHKRRSTLYILYPSNIICCFWCCKICGKAVRLKFFYSDKWWYTFCLMQHCPYWTTNYIYLSYMIWFLLIFFIKLWPTIFCIIDWYNLISHIILLHFQKLLCDMKSLESLNKCVSHGSKYYIFEKSNHHKRIEPHQVIREKLINQCCV